MKKRQPFV